MKPAAAPAFSLDLELPTLDLEIPAELSTPKAEEEEPGQADELTGSGKLSQKSKRWFTDPKLWPAMKVYFMDKHPDMPEEYIEEQREKFLNHFDGKRLPSYKGRFANWLTSRYADPYEPIVKKGEDFIFDQCLEMYRKFAQKKSAGAQNTKEEYDALRQIMEYFRSNTEDGMDEDEVVVQAWGIVLNYWHFLDDFLKKMLTLRQINANIVNITAQIKDQYGRSAAHTESDQERRSFFREKIRNRAAAKGQ